MSHVTWWVHSMYFSMCATWNHRQSKTKRIINKIKIPVSLCVYCSLTRAIKCAKSDHVHYIIKAEFIKKMPSCYLVNWKKCMVVDTEHSWVLEVKMLFIFATWKLFSLDYFTMLYEILNLFHNKNEFKHSFAPLSFLWFSLFWFVWWIN